MKAVILVEPTAKGRPRVALRGKFAHAYTPAKTRITEADVKAAIRKEVAKCERFAQGEPLVMWVTFYRVRPKSASKKVNHPVTRPDVNNYVSLLFDALNKFAYPDDSQIVNIHAKKAFAEEGSPPRIEFVLEREDA